jgi:integrase
VDDSKHLFSNRQPSVLLGEASLAEAIAMIKLDTSIPASKRKHWLTSLTVIARAIGRPPESLPCRLTALRHHIERLNAAALGWEPKTLANHKSNVKAAINHIMKVKKLPARGAPLSGDWKELYDAITDVKPCRLLSGFVRYCSVREIKPTDANEQHVLDYFEFRNTTGFLRSGLALPRELMKAWNHCVENVPGWPQHTLVLPALPKATIGPAWEEFSEGLRQDIEGYLADLAKPHKSANGRRRRSNKLSTTTTRRRELAAFARTAVASGTSLSSLTSLSALLHPNVVTPAFEAYLLRNGAQPKGYTIDLAWKLLSIAKTICASPEAIARLEEISGRLEEDRGPLLTQKNLAVIRAVMMSDIWGRVTVLPRRLMDQAHRMLNSSPKKALSLATLALQMQFLTRAPLRIGNLLSIKLELNLKRVDSAEDTYQLHFPRYDVKNRIDLDFTFTGQTAEMIDEFIHIFRPLMGGKQMGDHLFPGENGKNRSPAHASAYIAAVMEKEVGLRVTAHQFRHAAAAVILKEKVGDYEFVRRILGHKDISTTIRYYTALESFPATQLFGSIIEHQMAKHVAIQRPQRTRRKATGNSKAA